MIVPKALTESVKGSTSLCQSGTYAVVNAAVRGQYASQVTEFVHGFKDCFTRLYDWGGGRASDAGCNITSVFLRLTVRPNLLVNLS